MTARPEPLTHPEHHAMTDLATLRALLERVETFSCKI